MIVSTLSLSLSNSQLQLSKVSSKIPLLF